MVNTTIGVILLLLVVILFALYYHHKKRRVDVYADGFVFTDWRRSLVFRWDDVREVYASPIYRNTSCGYRSNLIVNWLYTVHNRKDGEKVKISGLEGVGSLGQAIQTEVSKWLLPWAMDAYHAGDNVRFGSQLGLSKRGIHVGESVLSWPDVEAVNLNRDNAVTIRQKGKRTPWKYIGGDKVANPEVLKGMISRVGGRQG
jgi:hypothetical protein